MPGHQREKAMGSQSNRPPCSQLRRLRRPPRGDLWRQDSATKREGTSSTGTAVQGLSDRSGEVWERRACCGIWLWWGGEGPSGPSVSGTPGTHSVKHCRERHFI